jgi:membrane-associated phospholipid phosphatase
MQKDAPATKRLLSANAWFFSAFGLFVVLGALGLTAPQGSWLMAINEYRTPELDWFFTWFTKTSEGFGQVLAFVLLLFMGIRRLAWGIPLGAVLATLCSTTAKNIFSHPRPRTFFSEKGLLAQIDPVPGVHWLQNQHSFPSGHTLAAFTLFSYLALVLPWKKWGALLCFGLALLVGFSRMYLVQHFFKDVYLGAILGVAMALLTEGVLQRYGAGQNSI